SGKAALSRRAPLDGSLLPATAAAAAAAALAAGAALPSCRRRLLPPELLLGPAEGPSVPPRPGGRVPVRLVDYRGGDPFERRLLRRAGKKRSGARHAWATPDRRRRRFFFFFWRLFGAAPPPLPRRDCLSFGALGVRRGLWSGCCGATGDLGRGIRARLRLQRLFRRAAGPGGADSEPAAAAAAAAAAPRSRAPRAQTLPPPLAMPQRMGELASSEPVPSGGRLAWLWILPLTLSGFLGAAWGASSLGAPHIHHFHGGGGSKHPSVPIAIYRSPASLRGGH
ncbi:hypothetical protein JRQ81_005168, partial [Phrynocephalus forsythii]